MKRKYSLKHIVIPSIILCCTQTFANNTPPLPIDDKINTIALQQGTPLWHHVQFFAKKNGELTPDSMKRPHDYLGITQNVDIKIIAILNMLDRIQMPHTVGNLLPIANPASSGIWGANGQFIEDRFNQLADKAILDNGNLIITKEIFTNFLLSIPRDGTEKEAAATVTMGPFIFDITWEQVTQGSVNELFEFLGDYTLNQEKAFTVNELRRFYMYPDDYMQEIINKRSDSAPLKIEKCPYNHAVP